VFVDVSKVDFERGVLIFVKASLGLPYSFPHVVAGSLLRVKHVKLFHLEQLMKLLLCWENRCTAPAFKSLLIDRCAIFPTGVGLNARLGDILVELGLPRTMDYCEFYQVIISKRASQVELERRENLLSSDGRAFWTELGTDGLISLELIQVLSLLPHNTVRIFTLSSTTNWGDFLDFSSLC
jgi:hypothetical protein